LRDEFLRLLSDNYGRTRLLGILLGALGGVVLLSASRLLGVGGIPPFTSARMAARRRRVGAIQLLIAAMLICIGALFTRGNFGSFPSR